MDCLLTSVMSPSPLMSRLEKILTALSTASCLSRPSFRYRVPNTCTRRRIIMQRAVASINHCSCGVSSALHSSGEVLSAPTAWREVVSVLHSGGEVIPDLHSSG
jgi:hypothetical protein